ncbi:MAG: TIGR03986 family CRISPR-associated RAMP protein, partial [Roseiflexus sp.]|nr:TIGR03986 family CRISPR-associated RAMP protein [Roseiflexus sp.]
MAKHKGKKMPNPGKPHKGVGNVDRSEKRDLQPPPARVIKSSVLPVPWPAPKPPERRGEYRFLNPYNFVRYLPEPVIPSNDPDAQLLGRCAPPPHDRYVGLTGRITCTLEAVMPLFISDSHDILVTTIPRLNATDVQHKSYRFFQYEGRDAIPATSLRGMIRSLFEAVTNAPFSVFNGDERLEYRIDPIEAQRFKPGIVQSLPDGDQPGVILLCEEAKIGAYYEDRNLNVLKGDWQCGEEAYAIITRTKNNTAKVKAIARHPEELPADGESRIHHGWVKVTGRTIETKRNESFFYFKGHRNQAQKVFFDADREADFNAILYAQLHERRDDFRSQVQSDRLAPGNLVYIELETNKKTVRNIALAKVARLRYRCPIGDLLPNHLKPADQYEKLDIASRVFGWVRATPAEDRKARVAYAGRVRFSHAVLTEDKGVYAEEMPLAILSSPKPTTTLFYLRKKNDEWSEEERRQPGAATTIGYDGPNELRGRKFYRHHGNALNRLEYERAERRCDHQNRSARGVRAPGNVFQFTIDFHNLAPAELGALLWTLRLGDEGCFFRLGYAKPLGFGSIKLSMDRVELLDPSIRYGSLATSGWRNATPYERGDWQARFGEAMKRCYGKSLRDLPNIADLIALLSEPGRGQPLPVHYPR